MSVRRRGKRLVIDYYPQGREGPRKRLTLPVEIQDVEEARIIEAGLKRAREPESVNVLTGATVSELFTLYLEWYKLHRKPTSYENLKWTWEKRIEAVLGHVIAEAIKHQHLETYMKVRKATGVSNRTVNKELSLISGFLRWASDRERGYIGRRDFKPEALPHSRPVPIVLSFDEAARIINATANPIHRAFFLCLYTLGLRFSEARFLKWEDFDLANGIMRTVQKGGSYKIIPVSRWLLEGLKALRPKKKGYIFISRMTGRPITDVRKALTKACKAAKVNKHVNPHLFRHSLATFGMGKNINLRVIQGYLGHADVATTEFYTHVVSQHLEVMRNLIDEEAEAFENNVTTNNKLNIK